MNKISVDSHGTLSWENSKGDFHRKNGPAIIYPNGDQYWYINGKLHRVGGPAVIWANGESHWYTHSKLIKSEYP